MSVSDPRDPAEAPAKNPVDPGSIDEFVRSVRSRAAADGTPAAPQKTQFKPLYLIAAAAAALIVVVVIRAWPTIDEGTGILGSRLISALTPTRLVEAPSAAPADPATAAAPRRATRPAPGAGASRASESSPSAPSGDEAGAARPGVDLTRAADTASAAPGPEGKDVPTLDTVVYSTADSDVEPPKLRSQGPGQPARVESERTRILEVLVKPDGTVEQVQLKSTEPQLLDPILLSHAKMWQFDPAQRGGRSVAYRLVLMWDAPK